jgi:hypothetical protein
MSRLSLPLSQALVELGYGEDLNFDKLSTVGQIGLLTETIVHVSRKANSETRQLAVKELRSAACRLDLELSDEFFV